MEIIILIAAGIAVALALAMLSAPLWMWTGLTGVALIVPYLSGQASPLVLWPLWGLLLLANVPAVRHTVLTAPVLRLFKKLAPPMSSTEREALNAGTVWWDAELFAGNPDWKRLLKTAKPSLTGEEQAFLDGPTEQLCAMLDDWKISHELRDLPPEVWDFIKREGFFGLIIDKAHGGKGFSAQAHSAVVSKISTRSLSAAVTIIVPNSLGPAELLHRYGTKEQQSHYLPRLATGEEIPCFALTGPTAGSDAASIPDRGVVGYGEHNGETVLGLRLTWEKRYITLAPVATVLGLAFRAYDPDGLLGSSEQDLGITLALVPTSHPGVQIGRRHFPSSQVFMNGPTSGRDVFIPIDWVIGGPKQVGQGWRMLMNCLAAGRSISLPGLGTAAAKMAARMSGAYARVRKQFRVPIGKLEGVEEPLTRIAGQAYALESARRLTTVALDDGHEPSVISAMVKYRSTEGMRQALNDAMDIHGGRAICAGPSNYLLNAFHAIPVGITVEGANILSRSMITFGQGALRCHPWLLRELESVQIDDHKRGIEAFDAALCGHVSYSLKIVSSALVHNLTAGRLLRKPLDGPTAGWFRQVSRTSANFALLADMAALSLGGELKRREKLSGRLADVLTELYLLSATLKRYEDDERPAADRPLVDWVCANSLYQIQDRFDGILANLPARPLAWLLRRVVFPYGLRQKPPSDELGHQVAALLLEPSATRDRITDGVYVNHDEDDLTGCVEYALDMTLKAEPIEARIRDAVKAGKLTDESDRGKAIAAGIMTKAEAELLTRADVAIRKAIMVDDFAREELTAASANANIRSVRAA